MTDPFEQLVGAQKLRRKIGSFQKSLHICNAMEKNQSDKMIEKMKEKMKDKMKDKMTNKCFNFQLWWWHTDLLLRGL